MQTSLYDETIHSLKNRGVALKDIGELVLFLQKQYYPDLTIEDCLYNIERVLKKREVQNTILTAIALDTFAEQKKFQEPLQTFIHNDEGLYGVDETLALAIINIYGSIGFTNFGFLDKEKPGILGVLNEHKNNSCHTFLDDIVSAIAAAAASRLAHNMSEQNKG